MCFLTFFSFGLKFIWKRGIGHVGHHQSVGEPFTFSPRTLPSHLLLWTTCKYIFHLLWPTCRYILANTLFSIFLLDNTQIYLCKYYIFHLSFGQHANIFGQILYFPSSFKTKCKYFFADIFPPALDNMQIYFHFLGQQANRCLHFGCFMPKLGLCRKPSYPKIKKWLQFI